MHAQSHCLGRSALPNRSQCLWDKRVEGRVLQAQEILDLGYFNDIGIDAMSSGIKSTT